METYLARPSSVLFFVDSSTYFPENREIAHQITCFALNVITSTRKKIDDFLFVFRKKSNGLILTEFPSYDLLLKKSLRRFRFRNKKQKSRKIFCVTI